MSFETYDIIVDTDTSMIVQAENVVPMLGYIFFFLTCRMHAPIAPTYCFSDTVCRPSTCRTVSVFHVSLFPRATGGSVRLGPRHKTIFVVVTSYYFFCRTCNAHVFFWAICGHKGSSRFLPSISIASWVQHSHSSPTFFRRITRTNCPRAFAQEKRHSVCTQVGTRQLPQSLNIASAQLRT